MASRIDVSSASLSGVSDLARRFAATRRLTLDLAAPLSDADASAQSMPDASPAKWHLAHTTWFFESFVLRDHQPGYRLFDDRYPYLFNSYYEAEGPRHARARRGLLTRPSLDQVRAWRDHVDAAVQVALPGLPPAAHALIELGIQHEQQHQELLLTDIKHLFAQNPLGPALWKPEPRFASEVAGFSAPSASAPDPAGALTWVTGAEGIVSVGHDGDGFAFDCEVPRFSVLLTPHALASRPVTNGEWQQFIADGGYRTASLWLSDGWAWVQEQDVDAPAYWRDGRCFTLSGWREIDPDAPVTHINLFEADAFAAWAGARLPTEHEWEAAAAPLDPAAGQQLDAAGPVQPAAQAAATGLQQMFGSVWEWTGSAYRPYPGFRPAPGAVGEYNGKFMSGQFVLKGGSCATPRGHVRASYRNFFYPHQRWQFTGLRLARDL
ncbi:ergothioneine biosynthesis protein EgtB [Sphingopyxis granuli]|uniref:ergothioneine biosynthesis protein EgtB n=1 Tax=Sphingopyxis granuli TaxID=267128 RepID=UPI001F53DF30|nr:ergothioneine biosynthesis protein EgtB [Sphingopyxis granuli]UNK80196.1 ergothioneine biosynthesis protein EgtB [Sphingopyxis granuli]